VTALVAIVRAIATSPRIERTRREITLAGDAAAPNVAPYGDASASLALSA
jgi:hypothetical protein